MKKKPGKYPVLLTPTQVARILNVSLSHVYRLLRAGILPSIQVGRLWRIPRAGLRLYVRGELPGRMAVELLRELKD